MRIPRNHITGPTNHKMRLLQGYHHQNYGTTKEDAYLLPKGIRQRHETQDKKDGLTLFSGLD